MRTTREFAAPAPAGAVWAASFLRRSQPSLSSREVSPQATEGGTLPSCCAGKSEEFCSRYAVLSPLWWKGGGGFAAGGMLPTAQLRARRETPSRQRLSWLPPRGWKLTIDHTVVNCLMRVAALLLRGTFEARSARERPLCQQVVGRRRPVDISPKGATRALRSPRPVSPEG